MEVGFNRVCPKCNVNIIKNHKGQQCGECYHNYLSNKKPYNYKGACVCECGNKKAWHAKKCRSCNIIGLADCIVCGGKLSVYKNSTQYNTGICQECYRGENCKIWKPEITMEERENSKDRNKHPLSREWRQKVFGRDNFTCQKCGQFGQQLCSHHIENYSKNKELRFDVDNGVTFCTGCHIRFHKKYGWFKSTREHLNDYLKKQKAA